MAASKKPTFVLCAPYDFTLVMKIKSLRAFEITEAECFCCKAKVILSDATRELMKADPDCKPICPDCSNSLHEKLGTPNYRMTLGQLREVAAVAVKMKAKNN